MVCYSSFVLLMMDSKLIRIGNYSSFDSSDHHSPTSKFNPFTENAYYYSDFNYSQEDKADTAIVRQCAIIIIGHHCYSIARTLKMLGGHDGLVVIKPSHNPVTNTLETYFLKTVFKYFILFKF